MTGSADLLKAKEEIWELKMQNIIVIERWERLQRETASLKTVSHGTRESFSLQRQQALCLNTLFFFFFFLLRLQRRKLGRCKRYKMSGNIR